LRSVGIPPTTRFLTSSPRRRFAICPCCCLPTSRRPYSRCVVVRSVAKVLRTPWRPGDDELRVARPELSASCDGECRGESVCVRHRTIRFDRGGSDHELLIGQLDLDLGAKVS